MKNILHLFIISSIVSFIIIFLPKQAHSNPCDTIDVIIADAKSNLNNIDTAFYLGFQALEKAINLSCDEKISDSYNVLGVLAWYNNEFRKSIEFSTKSMNYINENNYKAKTANNFANIGLAYLSLGSFDSSLMYYDKALIIREEIDDKKGAVNIILNQGSIYWCQGKYAKSIQLLLETVTYYESIGDSSSISLSLNNIGGFYVELEKYTDAIPYFMKSLKIDEKLNKDQSYGFGNLANLYLGLMKYDSALYYYNKSIEFAKKRNNITNLAEAYNGIGNVYNELNQATKAIEYYENSLKLNNELNNQFAISNNYLGLSKLYLLYPESVNKSILYAKKALEKSIETGSLQKQAEGHELLYEAYKILKDNKKSLYHIEIFTELNDSVFNEEKHKQISELETKYQTEKKEQEIISLQQENEIQIQKVKAQRRLTLLIGSSALLILLIGMIFYLWNKAKQKNIRNELKIKNLLTEQKMLRSQMNPHFIYNSLNSIQSFISSDESYQAEKYLARFAKLMRGILENSRVDFVSLDKEIEVLELYLELEQLRFEKRFTFNFIIDENIESDYVSIPPMLIQPFIENAILHGLKTKTDGILNVTFNENEDYIICCIEDNGIGRKASENNQAAKKYKSLATTITQERLDTLSKELNITASFTIEDKIDENNKPLGTKVILQLPFIET